MSFGAGTALVRQHPRDGDRAGAEWPRCGRSLLDPADGLHLARLRVGAPLPHVLVLAGAAVALQQVLEAAVPWVLRADPPGAEGSASQGWGHRDGAGDARCRGSRCPRYSRAGADEEGADGAAAPAQGGQRGAVVAQLPPPALEVLLLEQHQPATPVVLQREGTAWARPPPAPCPLPIQGRQGSGTAPRQALLTAQVMGRKEHILSTR